MYTLAVLIVHLQKYILFRVKYISTQNKIYFNEFYNDEKFEIHLSNKGNTFKIALSQINDLAVSVNSTEHPQTTECPIGYIPRCNTFLFSNSVRYSLSNVNFLVIFNLIF